jgi:hypothetical protein
MTRFNFGIHEGGSRAFHVIAYVREQLAPMALCYSNVHMTSCAASPVPGPDFLVSNGSMNPDDGFSGPGSP